MNFEVIVEDAFKDICTSQDLAPINNKEVLSLGNDFEEGSWRYSKFQNFIWDNIAETSLSQSEREALVSNPQSILIAAAKNLRLIDKDKKDIGKGSELAEIVLYGIMKHYYKALPVVPKIFYKQNVQDNAKGADSVHIVLEGQDDFSIWFGEAKFYNDISDNRLIEIVKSVGNSLNKDKLKKENAIITNLSDINLLVLNDELKNRIFDALDNQASIDTLKPKLHIPILLLHECKITANTSEFTEEYIGDLKAYHKERANKYFEKQLSQLSKIHLYQKITFHLILFPVPNKSRIVDKFIKNVEHYKEEVDG